LLVVFFIGVFCNFSLCVANCKSIAEDTNKENNKQIRESKQEKIKQHLSKKKQSKNLKQWIHCIIWQFGYKFVTWRWSYKTETCRDNVKINNKIFALDGIYCEPNYIHNRMQYPRVKIPHPMFLCLQAPGPSLEGRKTYFKIKYHWCNRKLCLLCLRSTSLDRTSVQN
jgi:hypothetical protein